MAERRRGLLRRAPRGPHADPEVELASEAFARTLAEVEVAKAALVSAVRSGRAPGAPLAEALAGFDAGLTAADASMPDWRIPAVEDQWTACFTGLAQARAAAESLRLSGRAPEIYEELIGALDELLDPLACFEDAAGAFRRLGVRL
jgi:hypothetical protein